MTTMPAQTSLRQRREATVRGLDLRKVRGLNRQQIDLAIGDHTTQLPDYLLVLRAWSGHK